MSLKSVYRRLTARMKAREPWTVTFTRDMPEEIFLSVMEVVKKAPSAFGVIHTTTDLAYQLSYSKETRLLRDFSKLCNTSREDVKLKRPGKEMSRLQSSWKSLLY